MQEIIIAAISAVPPIIATITTTAIQAKTIARNAAKESILQMILEDRMDYRDGKLPSNYQNILHEFDIYKKTGGNSYIEKKTNEYIEWYERIQSTWKNGATS